MREASQGFTILHDKIRNTGNITYSCIFAGPMELVEFLSQLPVRYYGMLRPAGRFTHMYLCILVYVSYVPIPMKFGGI